MKKLFLRAFQFQSGAIKRNSLIEIKELFERFQFQSGAIKRGTQLQNVIGIEMFQFQSGAIKSIRTNDAVRKPSKVSIPKWCD